LEKWVLRGIGLLTILIFGSCLGYPQYNVYAQRLDGEAELAKANYSKQVAVQEANAKKDSATLLAEAEVMRAEGVAKANKAAHPTRSGSHDEYGTAMQMVGHRHGKFELVALVHWLLVLIARDENLPGKVPDPSAVRAARRMAAEYNAAKCGRCSCPDPVRQWAESIFCSNCEKVIPLASES